MDTTSKTIKPDIVILTTCVDRPELHTSIFQNYVQYIGNANVHWVITINNISNQLVATEQNLRVLLEDFDIHIKTFDTGGTILDCYSSVKYCINHAFAIKPNIGYFWLEDDWSVKNGSLQEDIQHLTNTNCHVSLANRNEVSFNPSLWDAYAFEHLMYNSINNPAESIGKRYVDGDNTNPERICCSYPEATKFVNKLVTLNRFADAGRAWQHTINNKRTFNVK
jgi:hypothetical protein